MTDTVDAVETNYTLELAGPGLSLKRGLDELTAMRVMAVVMGGQPKGENPIVSTTGLPGLGASDPALSVGEFVDEASASTNPEKITAFAVYLKQYRGRSSFTRADIKPMFEEAGEPLPRNFGRDFRNAANSKWIASSDGGTNYFVTKTGHAAVQNRFSGAKGGNSGG